MEIEGTLRGDEIRVGGDARQRFYDSRGYGRPLGGNEIALSRVEGAHLLYRGDLASVAVDGTPMGFEAFFADAAAVGDRFALRFLVYADLRERGFYLSPVREQWPGRTAIDRGDTGRIDFAVYERGDGPPNGSVAYRVRVVGEREQIPAAELSGVLAVVDEESDLTYFEATDGPIDGSTAYDPPDAVDGVLLEDRVVVWNAADSLYERGFYGQPVSGRTGPVDDALQLSLVEAASLAADGVLSLSTVIGRQGDDEESDATALSAVTERGRRVEGERFDRRLAVYRHLRKRGVVPKTGFKFGADFRTYANVESVEELPHSEALVRVVPPEHVFDTRELSLDVRLAGGVRKRMVFALTDGNTVEYRSVARLTP